MLKKDFEENWVIYRGSSVCNLVHIKYNDIIFGGARGVMVIVVGNGHSDASSNP